MKILAIYPALDPEVNDIAQVLRYLVERGHQVVVITARRNQSKSKQNKLWYENWHGISIFRLYERFSPGMIVRPGSQRRQVQSILKRFNPEVLLCSQEFTIRLGLLITQMLNQEIPIVVVAEFAGDLLDHGYRGILANLTYPILGLPKGKRFWPWLCKNSTAVLTCYPKDKARIIELSNHGAAVHFLPWCDQIPDCFLPAAEKEKGLAIYIGAFSKWKNTDAFKDIIPTILNQTPTERVLFIGSGRINVITDLMRVYGNRITHLQGVSRREALNLISQAYYGLTPVIRGGWGFIGDCWATKTPVVTIHDDYDLQHYQDGVVAKDLNLLVSGIEALYSNPDLYKLIQNNGYERYHNNHSAAAVGNAYERVLLESQLRIKGQI